MFFKFANFYYQFIQGFNWIAAPFTSMLKTSESTKPIIQPGEGVVGVGSDSKVGCDGSKLEEIEIDDGEVGGDEVDDEVGKKGQKKSKSKNLFKFKKLSKSKKMLKSDFFTFGAKLAFIKLRQAFFKAPILYQFDPEYHIRIKTDASGYAISGVLS